ncbi:hypothetical protein WS87_08530 [Burkholderia sp. MSMB0856]|uniref:YodC family protein n=1 Tax=Burkholderia sp. MSMB0856 TaxID=1637869 RepID=UPI000755CCB5|nr:DUF2158 domain-containing protein [Burkholderia sp. MSMB0856]AOJ86713.1 hypothetical protein WS87_08530 [Burkholderia sp. MSMB0856]KVH38054.1 hypothetical protein WS87_00140 [Burkholderia sp. MSMB0856]
MFTKGDTVELKSGGPKMTVAGVVTNPALIKALKTKYPSVEVPVQCTWFDGNVVQESIFDQEMLKAV